MTITYEKVAQVLEEVANYVDNLESKKQAAAQEEAHKRINKLAESYEASTGEELPEGLKKKLASLDQETLDHLVKVANNSSDSPESLGNPANDLNDFGEPSTTKEAAQHAEDKFLNWILND